MTYPLHLEVRGRRVLVVGAGRVAERRIAPLLADGALVTVVAPTATTGIAELARERRITWHARAFDATDVAGAWLVHAATSSPAVNAAVVEQARRLTVWAVRADDAGQSDAHTPAVAHVAGAVVSVSSGDPGRSVRLRDGIRSRLSDGSLAARPLRSRGRGSVVLIGGGPGDPDLITVRGRRELLQADVIVYDRLAPHALLDLVDDDVELVDAGKSPGHHALSQEAINVVIVDRARSGKRVARLKGGDPFVLGRGSEEVLACATAGIPVEVVPGVTSAVSAPAAAGIPVTHRGVSTGFVVISGHQVDDLDAIAATGLTTVVLMGVSTLPRLVTGFLTAGRRPTTPVAVIERAFHPDQRIVTGTLADIVALAEASVVENPAVIVIGDVVGVVPSLSATGATTREGALAS